MRRVRKVAGAVVILVIVLVGGLYALNWYVDRYVLVPIYVSNTCLNPGSILPKGNCEVQISHPEYGAITSRLNSLGMRDQEYAPAVYASSATTRILMLGDSFTHGAGVAQGREYHSLVEARRGGDVVLFNAGYARFGIQEEEEAFERFLPAVRPHVVVVGMLVNDLIDLKWPSAAVRAPASAPVAASGWRLDAIGKAVLPYLPQRLVFFLRGVVSKDWMRVYRTELDPTTEARFHLYVEVLGRMQATAARQDPPVALAVLLIPQVEQVNGFLDGRAGVASDAPFRHLTARLEGSGVAVLDSLPHFRSQRDPGRLYYPVDRHLTVEGHEVLADFLGRQMERLLAASPAARARRAQPLARGSAG